MTASLVQVRTDEGDMTDTRHMRAGAYRAVLARAALGVSAALLLAACLPADAGTTGGAARPRESAAVINVLAKGKDWRPDRPIKVAVVAGTLKGVQVQQLGGKPVRGRISPDGTQWVSTKALLDYGSRYTVKVLAVDSAGLVAKSRSSFRTEKPSALVHTALTPSSGTYGVGMPIVVTFDHPVPDRAAAQEQLDVSSLPAQPGSWYWVNDQMVRYRPKTYWEPGTRVTVKSTLDGVRLGKGVWGDDVDVAAFDIGDAMISTVDISTHQMTVRRNGEVIRTLPVTTGKPGWDTRLGVKVIMSKQPEVTMDAETIDVAKDDPEYYRLKVQWAMRLTWSGEYLHAAPWSVADQGHANVSHGCTGMSTENAAWLYSVSRVGDVVNYVNGTRSWEPWNGYTDWNIPWSEWQQGSALD
jgi:lipoprotein-anchoring transpeptidase ErfK/SrfK